MTKNEPDLMTTQQLKDLGYTGDSGAVSHSKPLLICDVDEVVLHLVKPFIEVIEERGFDLKSHSFKLTGNVFDKKTGREATQDEVWSALTQLFEEQATRQGIVDGVVENLNALAASIDIVFLTNMPHPFREIRRAHLLECGLEFPLVTNTRSKVPAIKILQSHTQKRVGFIDDTPKNLDQVRDGATDVQLFHFMADENFREMAGEIEGAHFSTGDWVHAREQIHTVLVENT